MKNLRKTEEMNIFAKNWLFSGSFWLFKAVFLFKKLNLLQLSKEIGKKSKNTIYSFFCN